MEKENHVNELSQTIAEFIKEVKPLDGEFSKFVDDNFYDLIDNDNSGV